MARAPLLRSIERLAKDHGTAERLGIAPADARERPTRGESSSNARRDRRSPGRRRTFQGYMEGGAAEGQRAALEVYHALTGR
jgi:hypothetical protein